MFRVLIKDYKALSSPIKADLQGLSYDVGYDALTSQNGTINLVESDDTISEGDIAIIIDETGAIVYKGKIKNIKGGKLSTQQLPEIFNDQWLYDIVNGTYLEPQVATSIRDFCDGKVKGSTWIDPLRALELSSFSVQATTNTEGVFEEQKEDYTTKLSTFIYSLYEKYGILVDIDIPIQAQGGTIKIFKPNYSEMTISDNVNAIQNVAITTQVESTNRLVVFTKGNDETPSQYVGTWVYTMGGIVKEPSTYATRLKNINTKIVFSDDPEETIIQANLPSEMFNHKITFDLMLDNKIYDFNDFKIGMPIKLFYEGHYYYSILTAYRIQQAENEEVIYANFTLGKVRTSLTKKLQYNYGLK